MTTNHLSVILVVGAKGASGIYAASIETGDEKSLKPTELRAFTLNEYATEE